MTYLTNNLLCIAAFCFILFGNSATAQKATILHHAESAAWQQKGEAAYQAADYAAAAAYFDHALHGAHDPYTIYMSKGGAELMLGFTKFAIQSFSAAAQLAPTRCAPLLCRAQANLLYREYDAVIKDCGRVLSMMPTEERAFYLRAKARLESGDARLAVADFDRVVRLNPIAANFNDRAFAKISAAEWQSAIADLDYALRLDPTFAAARSNRARAKYTTGDVNGALTDYNDLIIAHPTENTLVERGLIYQSLGKYAIAVHDFDAALRLNPSSVVAQKARQRAEQERSKQRTKQM